MADPKHTVIINSEKCIGCGMCEKDCVGFAIRVENGRAKVNSASCILCGHCEAICPQAAVTISGFLDEVEEFDEQTRLNPDTLMQAIKTRRTIRQFEEKEVSEEVIEKILEAGRLAPTAANGQKTSYVVLQKQKAACEKVAVRMFGSLINTGKKVIPQLKDMTVDENFFFKKAPLVIVIFAGESVSAGLAAQNMAFMAEANGLGVLFSGFFTTCVNLSGKIRRLMGVKKNPKAFTTLVIGYPAVKYHRTAHRKEIQVRRT